MVESSTQGSAERTYNGWFKQKGYVVVTGAAGMLGASVAKRVACEGGCCILVDIPPTKENLGELAAELADLREKAGFPARLDSVFPMDVTKDADIAKLTKELTSIKEFGHSIFGLFNNAGLQGQIAPIYDTDPAQFQKVIDVNIMGAYRVIHAVTTFMKDNGMKGAVVGTASTAAGGVPNMCAYAMSKAAMHALTGTASKDLAPFGIRVNSIAPGHLGGSMWDTKTEAQAKLHTQYWPHGDAKAVGEAMLKKVPMRRAGSAEEVSNVVAWLLSDEASFITGENVRISGGE